MEEILVCPQMIYKFHWNGDMNEIAEWMTKDLNRYTKLYPHTYHPPPGMPYMIMDWTVPEFQEKWKELYEFMMDSVSQVIEKNKLLYPKFFMQQIWGNIHNLFNQAHGVHMHSNAIWSSVLNIKCLPPNDTTFFYNPTLATDVSESRSMQHIVHEPKSLTEDKDRTFGPSIDDGRESITHVPGDFLLWRSNLPHSVDPFIPDPEHPDNIRSSVSANFWHYEVGSRKQGTYLHVQPDYINPDFQKGESGTMATVKKGADPEMLRKLVVKEEKLPTGVYTYDNLEFDR